MASQCITIKILFSYGYKIVLMEANNFDNYIYLLYIYIKFIDYLYMNNFA